MENNRLYRSKSDKVFTGVCGGLGKYFNVDPIIPRLIFVALTISSGVGLIIYILMSFMVPAEDGSAVVIDITDKIKTNNQDRRLLAGVILVLVGGLFLLQQLSPTFNYFLRWKFLLPVFLIVFGFWLLFKKSK